MSYREPPEQARARAKRWYNAHADRVIARSKAWRLAHPERYREIHRLAERRRKPVKLCASIGCGKRVETLERQIKFCKACSAFYRKNTWDHGARDRKERAA